MSSNNENPDELITQKIKFQIHGSDNPQVTQPIYYNNPGPIGTNSR
jgi:hypothetical protein